MKYTNYNVTDKRIPIDLDNDFVVDWNYGDILFDEELEIASPYGDTYIDSRIRIVVLQSNYVEYLGVKKEDHSAYRVYQYAYDKRDGWGAITFDGRMSEIDELGDFDAFINEIITNEKEMFIDRGSSVCTGDMPDNYKELTL